eukprot:m.61535 g.61535  ORF g.61535 m.61535 type:complete len:62 (+) comp13346_c0_seq1:1127-1312(+)
MHGNARQAPAAREDGGDIWRAPAALPRPYCLSSSSSSSSSSPLLLPLLISSSSISSSSGAA